MNQSAEKLADDLHQIRLRLGMYIGTTRVDATEPFLIGLFTGFQLCGLSASWELWRKVAAERGWENRVTVDPLSQMRARGFSEQAIIDELFAIYAETVRRAASASAIK